MIGIRNFIFGVILSLSGFALYGQLRPAMTQERGIPQVQNLHINLFKTSDSIPLVRTDISLSSSIKKQSLEVSPIVEASVSPEGAEDDEILGINIDDYIPIEYASSILDGEQAEVLPEDNDDKTALLPKEMPDNEDIDEINDTPWAVVKGGPNIKNKKLMEELAHNSHEPLLPDTFKQVTKDDDDVSYKVAEKIKQSIIFPIPDEILNDENLTPTFVDAGNKKKSALTVKKTNSRQSQKTTISQIDEVSRADNATNIETSENKGILNSISSWFSEKEPTQVLHSSGPQKKSIPSYSAENKESIVTKKQPEPAKVNSDLASFYSSLQATKQEYATRRILPKELKLSFQPGRAEISGSTLDWLKAFSAVANDNNDVFLQIRLDATASTELQKKRLNLLYTIFMNNGVDSKKIDTVFSLTEPNAFIIRTMNLR